MSPPKTTRPAPTNTWRCHGQTRSKSNRVVSGFCRFLQQFSSRKEGLYAEPASREKKNASNRSLWAFGFLFFRGVFVLPMTVITHGLGTFQRIMVVMVIMVMIIIVGVTIEKRKFLVLAGMLAA
jgi:hypothetical protein